MELYPPKKGKVGRYNCSSLWGIVYGYLSPEQFINGEEIDFKSALRMYNGTHDHEKTQKLLKGYECEIKKEYEIDGITLVGKVDAINKEEILEIKTSDKVFENAKRWHIYQGKIYCTLFNMPVCYIVQPVYTDTELYLKVVGEAKRNDSWFAKQIKILKEFHQQVYERANNKIIR